MASTDQHAHEHAHEHDHDHDHDHDAMDECIETCLQCHVVCTMSAQYCIAQGGDMADLGQVGVLLDCAEICQTSANFMVRGSPYHAVTCGACAEVCRACAEACRTFSGDENLEQCAALCERCAEHCEQMSASGAGQEEG